MSEFIPQSSHTAVRVYLCLLSSNNFNQSSTSLGESFLSLAGLGEESCACFNIPANESDVITSARAARVSACTCLSEETTVQFLALLPSCFNRLRMALSAVFPSRTKCAVTAPSFWLRACPAGAPSKKTSTCRCSILQNSCRMAINSISSSIESRRSPSFGIRLCPSIK